MIVREFLENPEMPFDFFNDMATLCDIFMLSHHIQIAKKRAESQVLLMNESLLGGENGENDLKR